MGHYVKNTDVIISNVLLLSKLNKMENYFAKQLNLRIDFYVPDYILSKTNQITDLIILRKKNYSETDYVENLVDSALKYFKEQLIK